MSPTPFPRLPVGRLQPNVIAGAPTLSDPQGQRGVHFVAEPCPGRTQRRTPNPPAVHRVQPDDVPDAPGLTRNDVKLRRLLEPHHVLDYLCQGVRAAVVLNVTADAGELRRIACLQVGAMSPGKPAGPPRPGQHCRRNHRRWLPSSAANTLPAIPAPTKPSRPASSPPDGQTVRFRSWRCPKPPAPRD